MEGRRRGQSQSKSKKNATWDTIEDTALVPKESSTTMVPSASVALTSAATFTSATAAAAVAASVNSPIPFPRMMMPMTMTQRNTTKNNRAFTSMQTTKSSASASASASASSSKKYSYRLRRMIQKDLHIQRDTNDINVRIPSSTTSSSRMIIERQKSLTVSRSWPTTTATTPQVTKDDTADGSKALSSSTITKKKRSRSFYDECSNDINTLLQSLHSTKFVGTIDPHYHSQYVQMMYYDSDDECYNRKKEATANTNDGTSTKEDDDDDNDDTMTTTSAQQRRRRDSV